MSFRSIILFYIQYLISQNDALCLQVTCEFPKIYHYHYTIHVYVIIHLCVCVVLLSGWKYVQVVYICIFVGDQIIKSHMLCMFCMHACIYYSIYPLCLMICGEKWFFFLVDTWYWFNGWLMMLKRFCFFFVFFS